jgi:hypothetical protein
MQIAGRALCISLEKICLTMRRLKKIFRLSVRLATRKKRQAYRWKPFFSG